MAKISTRLANIMLVHDFLRGREMHPINYTWKPFEPITQDEVETAAKLFYPHCMERLPSGPRWKQMPNMGKGTILELAKFAGVKHQEPKKCFGFLVPDELYNRLKKMAKNGQIHKE